MNKRQDKFMRLCLGVTSTKARLRDKKGRVATVRRFDVSRQEPVLYRAFRVGGRLFIRRAVLVLR
jgi:hypothetical protein